jgi:hypothetical protein
MISILHAKRFLVLLGGLALLVSCKKDGNPNNLPDVSPDAYIGKIDGFDSSEQIFPENLKAYWSFDNTNAELRTGITPTEAAGNSFVTEGVRGSSLSLTNGYLYYATQLPQFGPDALKSWTISVWTKLKNNGSKQTMLFQNARPGYHWGNINLQLNTQSYPATNDSVIRLQPRFATANATVKTTATTGLQDNLNNVIDKFNLNDWLHIVLTYDISTGVFNNWINGVKVGNFSGRGTNPATQLFHLWQPNEIIIGSNYNGIPGKAVNSDVAVAPMTGQVDELRIYNISLPDAYVRALHSLGRAKQ